MGDKKPASYPVNHEWLENEIKLEQAGTNQINVHLHRVYKSLKESGMLEPDNCEIIFNLGLNTGKHL